MASQSIGMMEYPDIKPAGMSRNYFCVDCKSTTRNPRLYLEHRRDFHKEPISIHECELCVYASKHSQKLTRHLRTVHRDVVQNMQSVQNFDANPTGVSIANGLTGSLQVGKNTRLSICKLCGFHAFNKTVLMEHIRSQHTDVTIYECDQCDYSHYIRDRYNRHHRYHSMDQIQCKMCEFQTIYRWNLDRHMRHHIDSISLGFRCNQCNFTASTKQSITAHEIAHHTGLQLKIEALVQQQEVKHEKVEEKEEKQEKELKNEVMIDVKDEMPDFDPSAFLEVIMGDDFQPKPKNCHPSLEEVKEEYFAERHNELTKRIYFSCINCSFRNEIKLTDTNCMSGRDLGKDVYGMLLMNSSNNSSSSQALNSVVYRCGYCHQTSNWKHVIERHCRLVHNMIALIEKYSAAEDCFKAITPIKRRSDPSAETVVGVKKMLRDTNEECNDVKPSLN